MNDRFKLRVPVYMKFGKFKEFVYWYAGDGFSYREAKEGDEFWEIEQCTGLKDKNGRLIYEGDVIKIDSSTINANETEALVFWDACEASFNLQWLPKGSGAQAIKRIKKLAKHGLGDTRWWEVEIIGNIHENADLLEGGNEQDNN